MEAKRRADRKANPLVTVEVKHDIVVAQIESFDRGPLTPGPVMPEKVERPYVLPENQGWCKRCSELTDQWYQRTLDQAKIRLSKRCQRESEAELVI